MAGPCRKKMCSMARDVAGPICLRSFIGLTLQAARRALLSLSLIPTLRIMADGGIGLFLISELPAGAGNDESRRLPPTGVQCRNDYGEPGYGGPCPPPGSTHRYLVKAYALNVEKLPFGSETPPGKMARQLEEHSIGIAKLMVRLGR